VGAKCDSQPAASANGQAGHAAVGANGQAGRAVNVEVKVQLTSGAMVEGVADWFYPPSGDHPNGRFRVKLPGYRPWPIPLECLLRRDGTRFVPEQPKKRKKKSKPAKTPKEQGASFDNYYEKYVKTDGGEWETRCFPQDMAGLTELFRCVIGTQWPKKVGGTLFVESKDFKPIYSDSRDKLFAWIQSIVPVDWVAGSNYVTRNEFYEYVVMNKEK
jgi:hypothetical protein